MKRKDFLLSLIGGAAATAAVVKADAKPKAEKPPTSQIAKRRTEELTLAIPSLGVNTTVASCGWKDDYETTWVFDTPMHRRIGRVWTITGIDRESTDALIKGGICTGEAIVFHINNGSINAKFKGRIDQISGGVEGADYETYEAVIVCYD